MKISATIITLNEAANIRAACESLSWVDEIVVVDSGSTDGTTEIAAEIGARVFTRDWTGFTEQKQFALEQTKNDWALSLDADERISPKLAENILRLSKSDPKSMADGYRFPRRSLYMGRWIKAGGWYPDYQLRLFRKSAGHWEGAFVHESFKMRERARVETMEGDILHYSVVDASHHHKMIGERYAPLAAQKMFAAGRRTSALKIATAGPSTFIRNYLLKTGFRDGVPGFAIATFSAYHAFLKHLLLYEMQTENKRQRD